MINKVKYKRNYRFTQINSWRLEDHFTPTKGIVINQVNKFIPSVMHINRRNKN